MTAALLALAVAAAWLGSIAFVRMTTPLARIHAVSFVNIATGLFVALAVAVDDGFSPRALKAGLIWLVTLATSALLSHVTARSLHLRDAAK